MSSLYKKSSSDDLFGTASFGGGSSSSSSSSSGGGGSRTCRTVIVGGSTTIGGKFLGSKGGIGGAIVGDAIADRVCESREINGNYHGSHAQKNDFHNAGTPNSGPR